ncbi:MAG: DUF1801 domain-containing protein [Candidatus Aminicenantes bacterium]|nr:MAG: DUF1801 domain-containing protein [Candidatus Aminicenantes bacterium]
MVSDKGKNKEVDKLIAKLEPSFTEIVGILRNLIFEVEPEMEEKIKWKQPVYSLNGDVCYIGIFKKHIDFGFFKGVKLKDPAGLLEGSGSHLRYVKIRNIKDIQKRKFKAFIKDAVKLNKS